MSVVVNKKVHFILWWIAIRIGCGKWRWIRVIINEGWLMSEGRLLIGKLREVIEDWEWL